MKIHSVVDAHPIGDQGRELEGSEGKRQKTDVNYICISAGDNFVLCALLV